MAGDAAASAALEGLDGAEVLIERVGAHASLGGRGRLGPERGEALVDRGGDDDLSIDRVRVAAAADLGGAVGRGADRGLDPGGGIFELRSAPTAAADADRAAIAAAAARTRGGAVQRFVQTRGAIEAGAVDLDSGRRRSRSSSRS